ncbi:MAG: YkgJ family cysteine cluster protein [Magnetococcales bacterium]|nr:YkgJ family cysteine cluster protein [Magnetococcales bacterium]
MRDVPREVRNVLQPSPLGPESRLKFRCHKGVSCFNACCSHIDIVLTPYDMIRLRQRLGITPEAFLYEFAEPSTLTKGQLPVALLAMDKQTGRCPFNTPEGCSVYEDRPVTCRYYPIGMALMHRQEASRNEEFFVLIKEDYCKGHEEPKEWSVAEWRADQGADLYDAENREWFDIIVKRRSAGDMVKSSLPLSEFFYMASTNPDEMRRFVFQSSFLKRYTVDEATVAAIREDDAALTRFAFRWMSSAMFGEEGAVAVRPEAVQEARERRAAKAHAAALERVARAERGEADAYPPVDEEDEEERQG